MKTVEHFIVPTNIINQNFSSNMGTIRVLCSMYPVFRNQTYAILTKMLFTDRIFYIFGAGLAPCEPFFRLQSASGCGKGRPLAVRQYAQMCLYLTVA